MKMLGCKRTDFYHMYNESGIKTGIWTELHEYFYQNCKVTFTGEQKNGIRVGQWKITYKKHQIGGGTYDQRGVKIGYWIRPHEKFQDSCQINFLGAYNNVENGQSHTKIKKLVVVLIMKVESRIAFGLIFMKTLASIRYNNAISQRIVTFTGEYINGIRVGQWITSYNYNEIAGGTYDKRGVKIGDWIELHENFCKLCQVSLAGAYCNGVRVGEWITFFRKNKIGGGTYDRRGVKNGIWTDLHERFHQYFQVTIFKEYKNGVPEGHSITKINVN